MSAPLIYAITLNWNRANETLRCLKSLGNQTHPNTQILVVDNNSKDGSPDIIAKQYTNVLQIINKQNLGFAKGMNVGLRYALENNADYVFISNNDAYIAEDCLATLIKYQTLDTGILAPIIYYADYPQKIWSTAGIINPRNLEVDKKWSDKDDPGKWPDYLEVDFTPGCGMLFHQSTLKTIGLFDENFTMYYDDLDYCLRVKNSNLSIKVVPAAKMWHQVARSSGGNDSPNERYWMARSSVRYFTKHANHAQAPYILIWRTGSALRTSIRLLRKLQWQSLKAYWKGIFDGLRELSGANK